MKLTGHFKTTGGTEWKKYEPTPDDNVSKAQYYKVGESGSKSRFAYAGASQSADEWIVRDGEDVQSPEEGDSTGVTPTPEGPEDWYDRVEITSEVDEDDPRSHLDRVVAWRRDEYGIPIQSYPTEARIDELRELTEERSGDFFQMSWGLRYKVLTEEGEEMPGNRMTTRFLMPEDDGMLSFEMDFRDIVEQLVQVVNDYDAVIVEATVLEGYDL